MNSHTQPLRDRRPFGSTRLPVLLLALLLVGAVVVVYGRACRYPFLAWDDKQHVVDNAYLNPVTWHSVGRFWQKPYWNLYIPLSYTFFAAEASIARQPVADSVRTEPNPIVFHTGSLLLHIGCVLLVFSILRKLFRDDKAACAGALLFALHPVQVESVVWISETRGLLCALFSLLAIWQYLNYTSRDRPSGESPAAGDAGERKFGKRAFSRPVAIPYCLATVCFAAALLCKPAAVAVPLIVAVLDWGLLRRPWRRVALAVTPWLILAADWVVLTKQLQPDKLLAEVAPMWARPLLAGEAVAFYLLKLIAPIRCGPDYGHDPTWVMRQPWFLFAWMLPVAVVIALACLKHRRLWLVAVGVSIAWTLPVLGFVPFVFQRISTVADRYLYLALLGPAMVLCWLLTHRWNRWTVGLTSTMVCLLAVLSFLHVGYWRDNATLFRHTLQINPRSVVARHNGGILLAEQGRHGEAVQQYRKALKDHSLNVELYLSLGTSLVALGQAEEAVDMLHDALQRLPREPSLHCKLGNILRTSGNLAGAEKAYRAALRLDPSFGGAHLALGKLAWDLGRADAAITHYHKAIEAVPEYVEAHVNLGAAMQALGRNNEARRHYQAALEVRPDWPSAHYNLANLAVSEGNTQEAIEHYGIALRFAPDHARAHVNLGIVLFMQGKATAAIEHYRTALEIEPALVPAHVQLGRALAAEGEHEEAIATLENALQLVSPESATAQQIRSILRTQKDL